ncbi:hypothetical protein [Aureispira anguillae]|uniref:Uncharacterized protein n=1 Tax=Aureispira anguillae TaxID=2864201 RepID=A0A915YCS2_9BACT|nr:hypothetical protein [Aureispira anguillae]BDS10684.1 hypothetical protein AsAng_0013930 [Aureispira anguillae]
MDKLEFQYKPNLIKHLSGVLFFLLLFFSSAYFAITNERGVIIGIIELSKENATFLYLVFALLFISAVINSSLILYKSFLFDRKIIIEKKYISAPKNPISNDIIKIYYKEVFRVNYRHENKKLTFLTFFSKDRKLLTISRYMVPRQKDFEQLCALVKDRVKDKGIPPQKPTD